MAERVKVTVAGTGYVGLVTGACLAAIGHDVTCVDVRRDVIEAVNRGEAPFFEPGLPELIRQGLASGRFRGATDLAPAVRSGEVTFIAVATPSTPSGIDLSHVIAVAEEIGSALASHDRHHVVVVKSTVVPGTTDSVVRQVLARRAGAAAARIGLCMNPEFLREGTAVADFMTPDRIVIGESDPASGDLVAALYRTFECPILRTNLCNAEFIKYSSNALLALLVSFSNELGSLCERTPGTDIQAVMDALHLDRRLSPVVDGRLVRPGILGYLKAGSGFGGSCLPKDVTALRMFARAAGVSTPLLDAVMTVNERRPEQVADLVERAINGLEGKVVAVLGVTFKEGTDDLRDSPALALIAHLRARASEVRAYDPLLSNREVRPSDLPIDLAASPEAVLRGADVAVIATAWPEFAAWDWDALHRLMRHPAIVDGRLALRGVALPPAVEYWPIGRSGEIEQAWAAGS
jgi:UDPglucose 6-dehydrogenase/GDP-mannose 6-dehydrogenase